jgi:hypothetical protein
MHGVERIRSPVASRVGAPVPQCGWYPEIEEDTPMRDMMVTAVYLLVMVVVLTKVVRPRLAQEIALLNEILGALNGALTALPAH